MKEFLSWIEGNLSHMFALVGIILTIYFSIFYVPQYSEDIKLKRIEGMNGELISTIQELVYNKHQIDSHDIDTLVRGKELRDNIKYPYTVDQLLVQVQETFLANKFIPLESRKELVESIDVVRAAMQPISPKDDPKETSKLDWLPFIGTGFGVLASMLGFFSLFASARKQREEEVEERIVAQKEKLQHGIKKAFALEEFVGKKLESIYGKDNVEREGQTDMGVDYLVRENGNPKFGVEVKFVGKNLLPSTTINQAFFIAESLGHPVVLVTNASLSKDAKYKLKSFNEKVESSKVYVVPVDDIKNIEGYFSNSMV